MAVQKGYKVNDKGQLVKEENYGLQLIKKIKKKTRYGVAITWDAVDEKKPVDLDLQALVIDDKGPSGNIRDAVYYNNLVSMGGAVVHSGDETTGEADAFDEIIWSDIQKLPQQVKMIMFIVAASGESSLKDAANGLIHVLQATSDASGRVMKTVLERIPIEQTQADVDVVLLIERDDFTNDWNLFKVDELADHGNHFLDILEPTIGDIIRRRIDNAPKKLRVAFQMRKGCVVDLPQDALKRLQFAVKARIKPSSRKRIDLDVSAVFINADGKMLGACYFDNLEFYGIVHSGEKDCAEDLTVDLTQVPKKVEHIFILVNVLSPSAPAQKRQSIRGSAGSTLTGVTFADLIGANCQVTDESLKSLANFSLLSDASAKNNDGVILCRIFRVGRRWELQALGKFFKGATWKESSSTIAEIVANDKEIEREVSSVPLRQCRRQKTLKRSLNQQDVAKMASALRGVVEDDLDDELQTSPRAPTMEIIPERPAEVANGDEVAGPREEVNMEDLQMIAKRRTPGKGTLSKEVLTQLKLLQETIPEDYASFSDASNCEGSDCGQTAHFATRLNTDGMVAFAEEDEYSKAERYECRSWTVCGLSFWQHYLR